MAWKYLSLDEKTQHPLYNKFTAFKLFMIFQYFSLLSIPLNMMEFQHHLLNDYNLYSLEGEAKEIFDYYFSVFMSLFIFKLAFLLVITFYKKSHTAIKFFIAFLVVNPIVTSIASFIYMANANTLRSAIEVGVQSTMSSVILHIICGIIFLVYYHTSKAFNVQYLGRVKV